jgi:exodeoxyribonuclease VII small subunit
MAKKKRPTRDDRENRDEVASCFEDSLSELESIVAQLESGKLSLADALARYELGVKHLSACQRMLERAERRIELLSGVDADGNPVTRPFDDEEAASLEEKAKSRSQRRTEGAKQTTGKAGNFEQIIDDLPRLF